MEKIKISTIREVKGIIKKFFTVMMENIEYVVIFVIKYV